MRLETMPQTGCCSVCARPVAGFGGEFVCEDCRCGEARPCFDRVACALLFQGVARRMVLDYKFNRHLWLLDDLADLLEAAVSARLDVTAADVVLPMPTTLFHRVDRGYNQCDALARALARRMDRRFARGVLRRTGHPARQSALSADERRENARSTFAVSRPELVRGRTVIVVDDILTTGATLSDAARALKAAGAHRVWCAALARTVLD